MRTVVILDDQDPPLQFARRILLENGYNVVGLARGGKEAVEMCDKMRPDIAILDISMPGMTGEEAAHVIARDGTARVICMATSINMAGKTDYFRSLGFFNVTKPYRDRQMLNELRQIEQELDARTS